MREKRKKAYKGLPMEGFVATWYAKNTGRDLTEFSAYARAIANELAPGSRVLELAPGPGYLAIELAKLGAFQVVGLDISRSFVRIATENAKRAGVAVEFRVGDAAHVPFVAGSFDFIVCRAAFKNFSEPVAALREMQRVLKHGGIALVIDMRNDATDAAIDRHVNGMKLGWLDTLVTKGILKYGLRRAAYTKDDFIAMAAATPFARCDIAEHPIGFEVRLRK